MPTFTFHDEVNPIAAYKTEGLPEEELPDDDEFDEFTLSEDIDGILSDEPLQNEDTTSAIDLYWAPKPFNQSSGQTKRCYDVPLVQDWFKEHCP